MRIIAVARLTKMCELCERHTLATHILIQRELWGNSHVFEVCEKHAHEFSLKQQGY